MTQRTVAADDIDVTSLQQLYRHSVPANQHDKYFINVLKISVMYYCMHYCYW